VAVVFALWFLQDCAMLWLIELHRPNLWINHFTLPITTSILLWAFSLWQEGEVARMAFRIAIPLYVIVWLILSLTVERLDRFSNYASPISDLLLVCVAAYTLVTASLRSTEPVWRQEWLWIGSGILLYFGAEVVLMPLSNMLVASRREMLFLYRSLAVIGIVEALLITGGMLCAGAHPNSGGSFWQRHWQRESSPRRS
jgi:hypothetical protein